MKKARKALLTLCAALLLVSMTVGATVAYLTSTTDVVKNTFTVGKVEINLDEAKVDEYGVEVEGADRVKANNYKVMPGHEYTKDPTVHVKADSEDSYVRMFVTITNYPELHEIFTPDEQYFLPQYLVDWDSANWWSTNAVAVSADGQSATYEFHYHQIVSAENFTAENGWFDLEPLFTTITIPGDVVNENNIGDIADTEITIVAQAIQADGFSDSAAAWAAFDTQN